MVVETVDTAEDQEVVETASVPGRTDDTDPAKAGGEGAAEPPADDDAADDDDEGAEELLSREEVAKLKDDPKALAKAYRRAYTQKTQAMAEERKFIKALRENPKSVVMELARRAGLEVKAGEAAPAKDEVMQQLEDTFGPEVAGALGPAFMELARRIVRTEVEPLRQATEASRAETARVQSEAVLKTFESSHPDWKKHENKMMAVAKRYVPAEGTTELQYLKDLYVLATQDQSTADATRKVVERMGKSVRASDLTGSTPASRVATSPVKPPTLREAFQAAKRGHRFED